MIFFKWYGKNIRTSTDIPEFHKKYKNIRTIGVSVFNKKSSTAKHYGPLRLSYRVLYNINRDRDRTPTSRSRRHSPLVGQSTVHLRRHVATPVVQRDGRPAYRLFVDIIRPSLVPWVLRGGLFVFQIVLSPFLPSFFKRWIIIK